MFKFFKCNHEYKEVGKYYTIVMDYDCKHIMAVSVSECAVCGERKSDDNGITGLFSATQR